MAAATSSSSASTTSLALPSPSLSLQSLRGGREKLDAASAASLVAAARDALRERDVAPGALRSLSLTGKSMDVDAARAFAPLLREMHALCVVDLTDTIAAQHEDVALAALDVLTSALAEAVVAGAATSSSAPSLVAIDLSDNALGAKGVRACAPLLRVVGPTLHTLALNNNGLAEDAAELLGRLLCTPAAASTADAEAAAAAAAGDATSQQTSPPLVACALRSLSLVNNMLGDHGARSLMPLLAHAPALEYLHLEGTRFSNKGGRCIARALDTAHAASLVTVKYNDNGVGGAALAPLCRTLTRSLSTLTSLSLAYASLANKGTRRLLAALAGAATPSERAVHLRHLDVSGNELKGRRTALALRRAAERLPALASLAVADNEFTLRALTLFFVPTAFDEELALLDSDAERDAARATRDDVERARDTDGRPWSQLSALALNGNPDLGRRALSTWLARWLDARKKRTDAPPITLLDVRELASSLAMPHVDDARTALENAGESPAALKFDDDLDDEAGDDDDDEEEQADEEEEEGDDDDDDDDDDDNDDNDNDANASANASSEQ